MIKILTIKEYKISISFPYIGGFVPKVKLIQGHKYHPERRYLSFPNTNVVTIKYRTN